MGSVKIVRASAGSGKTYQLAYAYIRQVIDNPMTYRNLLAVTFTNKATEEMKRRIVVEIHALAADSASDYLEMLCRELHLTRETIRQRAREVQTRILHDYSHFTILTIDKFFQRIIRGFLRELGMDLNFTLELQTDPLLESAADRLIERIASDSRLREWIVRFAEEKIDSSGRWDVRGEIIELGHELFKEQYRSSERAITADRLAEVMGRLIGRYQNVVSQIIAVGADAVASIAKLGLTLDDFAYKKAGFASYFYKIARGEVEPYGARVAAALESDDKWFAKSTQGGPSGQVITVLRPLLEQLCALVDRHRCFLTTVDLLRSNYRSFALLSDLSEQIDLLCREQNIMPISETNELIARLIEGNDAPFIYEKVGNDFSRFMIDEFQDTSTQQWRNFVPLLENAVAQSDGAAVMLVGDVKQSIYRWRGGDWQILGKLAEQTFDHVEQQYLDTNFRSEEMVVRLNNDLVAACVKIDNAMLNTMLDDAVESDVQHRATLSELRDALHDTMAQAYADVEQKPHRANGRGYVCIIEDAEPSAETNDLSLVVELIEQIQQRGFALGDIAILVQTHAQGVEIADRLLAYKALHPESPYRYDVVTQEALQIDSSAAVQFVIAVLHLAYDPQQAIYRTVFNRFLGNDLSSLLSDEQRAAIVHLSTRSPEEAFGEIVLMFDLAQQGGEVAYLQALDEQIHQFTASRIADIPLFLDWWHQQGYKESVSVPQNRNAINITTIHKSKGLQYKAVIVPRCDWSFEPKAKGTIWAQANDEPFRELGSVPLGWKNDIGGSAFADTYYRERVMSHIDRMNLFYVAVTRAEAELYIIYPKRSTTSVRMDSLLSGVMQQAVDAEGKVTVGACVGRVGRSTDRMREFCFGEPMSVQRTDLASDEVQRIDYAVGTNRNRVKVRFDVQRYFEEGRPQQQTLRNYGILMHRLFEAAENRLQIDARLETMRAEGTLSEEEQLHMRTLIDHAMEQPLIASWFSDQWTMVRNEANILIPQSTSTRRPDRVMVRATEAVVVDYKFGSVRKPSYCRQIGAYMELLRGMGYRTVRGYLWYVELDVVEEVGADV